MSEPTPITEGGGSVPQGTGFPDPAIFTQKAFLAYTIAFEISDRIGSQRNAATMLGLSFHQLLGILRGEIGDYTVKELEGYLDKVRTIKPMVKKKRQRKICFTI